VDLDRRRLFPDMTHVQKSAGIMAGTALIGWLVIAVYPPAGSEAAHRRQTAAAANESGTSDTSRGNPDRVWQQDLAVIAARNR
jgi:hypothetical protein